MALISAILLGLYFGAVVWVLFMPTRRPEPSAKIAASCLGAIAIAIAIIGAVLAIGVACQIRILVYLAFGIAVLPPAWACLGGIYYLLVVRPRRLKAARQWATRDK